MSKYLVTKRIVYTEMYEVDATTEEQARFKVFCGKGEEVPHTFEFSHDMDSSHWTTEKLDEREEAGS